MKLHLGCFNQPVSGWHNTDITPHIFLSKIPFAGRLLKLTGKIPGYRYQDYLEGVFKNVHYLDVAKKFPFADGSVSAVFSSHIIEHLTRAVALHMLKETYRVLRPGGVCRVVAPSLDWALSLYDGGEPSGMLKAIFEHDHSNPKNRHQWMYNGIGLVSIMREAGFANAEERDFQQGNLPDIELLDNRPGNSIYVEGSRVRGNLDSTRN